MINRVICISYFMLIRKKVSTILSTFVENIKDMKKYFVFITLLFSSLSMYAQYETDVPADMMNREYAQKADSLGKKILTDKGSYATAIELFRRSSTIYKQLGGELDPDYYHAMALLAKCYMRNDQLTDAIGVLSLLSDIYKKNKRESEEYAIIMDNLALYYSMANEPAKALETSKEVLNVCEKIELEKYDLLPVLTHSAENYFDMKEYAEAIRLQLRALDLAHQQYGIGSENYIGELKYLQQYYEGAGETVKAKKTAESIEKLEKPGGGVRPVEELESVDDCEYHRGDAFWCAEYYITHDVSAENAIEAGQYATMWCVKTDELTISVDEYHAKCIGDCPTALTAFLCGCLILGQSNKVKHLTREMERQAMVWTVRHYYHNREILVKTSPELDKLVEYLENDTLEEKLLELIPDTP